MKEKEIVKEMQRRYPEAEIEVKDVKKPGRIRHGLIIKEDGCNAVPCIYLDEFKELEVMEACDRIQMMYEKNKSDMDVSKFVDMITDFEAVRGLIQMQLVNSSWNEEYLDDKPHIDYLDLSILFYVQVTEPENGMVVIGNKLMEQWGTDEQKLYELAKENAEPYMVDMVDLMEEMGADVANFPRGEQLVISNSKKFFGAGVLPVVLDCLKEKFGNFYILPSSVHELIVLPATDIDDKKELDEMVYSTNQVTVSPEERLADHAYYFNGECLEV